MVMSCAVGKSLPLVVAIAQEGFLALVDCEMIVRGSSIFMSNSRFELNKGKNKVSKRQGKGEVLKM